MRTSIILALIVTLCTACADEPARDDATPATPMWLTDRPENAHAYADETLARFGRLVEGDGFRDAAWNAQGTLEVVHEKTGLTFVLIPAGEMPVDWEDDPPPGLREVSPELFAEAVPAFLLSTTECTQRAWDRIGGDDSRRSRGANIPIETVSWRAALAWCGKAGLRLPSGNEFEHACFAGTLPTAPNVEPSTLKSFAWRLFSASEQIRAVAANRAPNPWGLHDVDGNVGEWCEGMYGRDSGPDDKAVWLGPPSRGKCRAKRCVCDPDGSLGNIGFRPAADLPK
jgi:formylglycine-generating enzyme required for sulfatase activity